MKKRKPIAKKKPATMGTIGFTTEREAQPSQKSETTILYRLGQKRDIRRLSFNHVRGATKTGEWESAEFLNRCPSLSCCQRFVVVGAVAHEDEKM